MKSDHRVDPEEYMQMLNTSMTGSDKEFIDLISSIYNLPVPVKIRLQSIISRLGRHKLLKDQAKIS
jgi:hypothetical protein